MSSYQRSVCLFKTYPLSPVLTALHCPLSFTSFSSLFAVPLCLPGVDSDGKSPSKSELRHLYLTEKYVWRWKQFLSRRGKRTPPLDLKLGHNNWLRQVSDLPLCPVPAAPAPEAKQHISAPPMCLFCFCLQQRDVLGGSRLRDRLAKTGFFVPFSSSWWACHSPPWPPTRT